jgi:3-oxoacyl-[acyl-carrier protein] reductase
MNKRILITGTSRGIGKYLVNYYTSLGYSVIGCSRNEVNYTFENYEHFICDISDEKSVKQIFRTISKAHGGIDILINNAGIASMNHSLLTEISTVKNIFDTNLIGSFLFSREAAKLMQKNKFGRIINFSTVAVPLALEGEAIYASSKAAVISLTKTLSKELSNFGITVNAIGPTPVKTDLIKSIPKKKLDDLINMQTIKRYGEFQDISNVLDFFISEKSDFITGQEIYLGGV